ncbi:MAG TPA: radical SAM protein, partial [Candidatus Udaeobacter sp.]|nr:radical SAM protein [Candidatus Udaeobacter sp.]
MQARTSSQPLVDPRLTLDIVQQEFPDLPREALVKEDLLRQGIAFSPAALACTAVAKPKSYFIFSFDRVAISEMEAGEHRHLPEEIALAGGPWGFRRTIVSVRLNPESPYRVVAPEGESDARALQLELAGEPIADVILPERPAYYDRTLPSGRPLIAVTPTIEWGYLIYLTAFRVCQYFGRDEECRFCDINANYRQQRAAGRPFESVKDLDEMLAALAILDAEDRAARAYTITGGAILEGLQGQSEGEFYARYAEAIESRFPGRWIGKMVTQALPRPALERFRAAGIRIYHPNYEIWDAERFALICPGKARAIGRETWIRRIEEAATIFGPSRVIPNFVAGIELAAPYGFPTVAAALASTGEGLEYFMAQGITPRFTTWCPEPLSDLGSQQGPAPLAYHAGLLRLWRETHHRH